MDQVDYVGLIVYLWNILPINKNGATLNVIETEQKTDNGTFTASWVANLEGNRL